MLEHIFREVKKMVDEVAKITASVTRLETAVDRLLVSQASAVSQLTTLSVQLAAAIAAQDPAKATAVQTALDALAVSLDAESTKVEATLPSDKPGATGPTA